MVKMPRAEYVRCAHCDRHKSEVGPLSHSRLCGECARLRYTENMDALRNKRGPGWHRRTAGIARYLETLRAANPHNRSA